MHVFEEEENQFFSFNRTRIEIGGKLVEIIQLGRGRFLEIVFLLAGDEIGAGEGFLDPRGWILLMRRENFRVTVHVTIAASRHLENVHVQAQLVVPCQKPVVIVHLGAGRAIILGYESAARLWIPENGKWMKFLSFFFLILNKYEYF